MSEFPWSVEKHLLGLRNQANGELSAFVDPKTNWGLVSKGGFLVSCPVCFNSDPKKHCKESCNAQVFGAVFDHVPPINAMPMIKQIYGGPCLGVPTVNSQRSEENKARVVVLDGIIPYKWNNTNEKQPTVVGQPLFTRQHGFVLSTTPAPDAKLAALYLGDVDSLNEIYILLAAP